MGGQKSLRHSLSLKAAAAGPLLNELHLSEILPFSLNPFEMFDGASASPPLSPLPAHTHRGDRNGCKNDKSLCCWRCCVGVMRLRFIVPTLTVWEGPLRSTGASGSPLSITALHMSPSGSSVHLPVTRADPLERWLKRRQTQHFETLKRNWNEE